MCQATKMEIVSGTSLYFSRSSKWKTVHVLGIYVLVGQSQSIISMIKIFIYLHYQICVLLQHTQTKLYP